MKLSPRQREALGLVADGKFFPCLVKESDGWYARWHAVGVDNDWVDEYVREATMTSLSEDAEYQRHATLHDAWMLALRSRTGLVVWDGAECEAFAAELAAWSGNAASDVSARRGIRFSLDTHGEQFVVFCKTPKGRCALRALGLAAYVCGTLRGLRADGKSKNLLGVALTRGEAEDFVRRGARDLRDAGYLVDGVDIAAEVSADADIDVSASPPDEKDGQSSPKHSFRLVVRVDGEPVTADEIRFLLDQGSTLVFFRDRWIEVDRGILKEALRVLENGVPQRANALSFALGLGHVGRLEIDNVRAHGWLRGLVSKLRAQGKSAAKAVDASPNGFGGVLRGYQREGVAWLGFLAEHGFGALLADDMGLGKTVQIIAWMLCARRGLGGPVLVAAPLTLLANWAHEFAQFAPTLRFYVHQGDRRHVASGFRRAVSEADVVLTSYNLLVKDYSLVAEVEWAALVLDEAQAIKNPDTQIARAVRALSPRVRIALTGTPIENSVADLWSLEEFLNPGFLGERKAFVERFVRPIAADEHGVAAKRLRRALEPFVLRRLKTDPGIASELGEKHEIREYCVLAAAQRREYEAALADFQVGEHRQGDIFALLTRLKLVCDGFDGEKVEGSKLDRLVELVEQILENGESALVFTQYAKVGAALCRMLSEQFGRTFPFLHGGLDAGVRERMVRGFQNASRPDIFILSLKAGGFGLNLTKATHVIHYDRWWNPAVEGQATDRTHRIGQSKTVFVHLFVAAGTIEERVDEILRRKESLRELIADGQAFWRAAMLDGMSG